MLPDDRRDRIIRFARQTLTEDINPYLQYTGRPIVDFRDLMNRSPDQHLNPVIDALLRYGAELHAQSPAPPGVSWSTVTYPGHPKPASWLFRDAKTGFACILLDKTRVNATHYSNKSRLRNCLCLHEIGHIFFHWDRFFTGTPRTMAPHAAAGEESEAWCFCFAMIMFVAEQIAEDFADAPADQRDAMAHVWELISNLRL